MNPIDSRPAIKQFAVMMREITCAYPKPSPLKNSFVNAEMRFALNIINKKPKNTIACETGRPCGYTERSGAKRGLPGLTNNNVKIGSGGMIALKSVG